MSMQLYIGDVRISESVTIQSPTASSYNTGVVYETLITGISETITIS